LQKQTTARFVKLCSCSWKCFFARKMPATTSLRQSQCIVFSFSLPLYATLIAFLSVS